MNLQTVRCYGKAIRYGSKYIYQTVPRLLTLWLDMGEDATVADTEIFQRVNKEVAKAIQSVPTYKVDQLLGRMWDAMTDLNLSVVHCVPSDRLSCRTYESNRLCRSRKVDPKCHIRVSQARTLVVHISRQVYEREAAH